MDQKKEGSEQASTTESENPSIQSELKGLQNNYLEELEYQRKTPKQKLREAYIDLIESDGKDTKL